MIRWTDLAPWEFEFPFPGSLTSIYFYQVLANVALVQPDVSELLPDVALLLPHFPFLFPHFPLLLPHFPVLLPHFPLVQPDESHLLPRVRSKERTKPVVRGGGRPHVGILLPVQRDRCRSARVPGPGGPGTGGLVGELVEGVIGVDCRESGHVQAGVW